MDKPYYMKGLSRPEKLVIVPVPEPEEEEDETPMMMFWCVRHREYETEACNERD